MANLYSSLGGITLRHIRYFIYVAESGSISAASLNLRISQSTVTETIQALEKLVGASLFERYSKGVKLTREGYQLLSHAKKILFDVAEAEQFFQKTQDSISGELTLGVTGLVAGYYLADLLALYKRIYPGIHVQVIEDQQYYIEELLINGEIDIALLLVSNLINPQSLLSEKLIRSEFRLWLPADHRLMRYDNITLQDLSAEPFIMLTMGEMQKVLDDLWNSFQLKPNFVLKTSSMEAVRSLVATNAGLAILPDIAYRPWSLEGYRLHVRALADFDASIFIGLVWRNGAKVKQESHYFLKTSYDMVSGMNKRHPY